MATYNDENANKIDRSTPNHGRKPFFQLSESHSNILDNKLPFPIYSSESTAAFSKPQANKASYTPNRKINSDNLLLGIIKTQEIEIRKMKQENALLRLLLNKQQEKPVQSTPSRSSVSHDTPKKRKSNEDATEGNLWAVDDGDSHLRHKLAIPAIASVSDSHSHGKIPFPTFHTEDDHPKPIHSSEGEAKAPQFHSMPLPSAHDVQGSTLDVRTIKPRVSVISAPQESLSERISKVKESSVKLLFRDIYETKKLTPSSKRLLLSYDNDNALDSASTDVDGMLMEKLGVTKTKEMVSLTELPFVQDKLSAWKELYTSVRVIEKNSDS